MKRNQWPWHGGGESLGRATLSLGIAASGRSAALRDRSPIFTWGITANAAAKFSLQFDQAGGGRFGDQRRKQSVGSKQSQGEC